MEIILENNITGQVICEETLLLTSKAVVNNLMRKGYTAEFSLQAAAVFEWLNTLSLEDYDDVKRVIKLLK